MLQSSLMENENDIFVLCVKKKKKKYVFMQNWQLVLDLNLSPDLIH